MTSVVVRKADEKLAIDYWRDGYATAPSGFTSDEIAAWRAECDRLWRVVDGDPDGYRRLSREAAGAYAAVGHDADAARVLAEASAG